MKKSHVLTVALISGILAVLAFMLDRPLVLWSLPHAPHVGYMSASISGYGHPFMLSLACLAILPLFLFMQLLVRFRSLIQVLIFSASCLLSGMLGWILHFSEISRVVHASSNVVPGFHFSVGTDSLFFENWFFAGIVGGAVLSSLVLFVRNRKHHALPVHSKENKDLIDR